MNNKSVEIPTVFQLCSRIFYPLKQEICDFSMIRVQSHRPYYDIYTVSNFYLREYFRKSFDLQRSNET